MRPWCVVDPATCVHKPRVQGVLRGDPFNYCAAEGDTSTLDTGEHALFSPKDDSDLYVRRASCGGPPVLATCAPQDWSVHATRLVGL